MPDYAHKSMRTCLLLLLLQVLGAMAGAGLVVALTPATVYAGMGDGAPGCFDGKAASSEITKAQVFGWEVSAQLGSYTVGASMYQAEPESHLHI
jgi:hypothetical protein